MPTALRKDAFCCLGIDARAETASRRDLEKWAGACLSVDLLPFSEDRAAHIRGLASSSCALTLSWHEGFGLVGWEAIGAGVSLVLGTESGLYQLLHNEFDNSGNDSCCFPVDVRGHQRAGARKAPARLRQLIADDGWDWRRTARDLMAVLELPVAEEPAPARPYRSALPAAAR